MVTDQTDFGALKSDHHLDGLDPVLVDLVADVDDALLIVPLDEEQKIKTYVNEVKSKFGDKYL